MTGRAAASGVSRPSATAAIGLLATAILQVSFMSTAAGQAGPAPGETISQSYRGSQSRNVEYQKVAPIKVFDNLYYVGPGLVSVWLVPTDDGLILIDSAQEPYVDHVIDSIRKAGFDPKDVRYILLSHGHLDHFGGAARIQQLSGARVAALEEDWRLIEQSSGPGRGSAPAAAPKRDMVLREGQLLSLGKTTLTVYHLPGHTAGSASFEFTVYDDGRPHKAFVFGGPGQRNGVEGGADFLESIRRIKRELADVEVPVHVHSWLTTYPWPGGGAVFEPAQRLATRRAGEPHPFVNNAAWRAWLDVAEAGAVEYIERERAREQTAAPAGGIPRFGVDSAWPRIPNNWQFGQVASVSVDGDDHVWVLQRPGTLGDDEKGRAAPPVVVFTADGAFVRAWGGPGAGYEWPNSEHGIHVDGKGFVWISGNGENDHQVLKFTKDGRFVMQIGRAGRSRGNGDTENLNQPADAFVHAATNELIVADGYGNRRIIVFDADTGKFKRMWGAFGNTPTDEPPNPAPADADPRGAPQFVQPVHAARVSRDGNVYVSDRGGKRVQVFRLDGTYVAQVFIGRECRAPECGNGTTAASTAFSSDPDQRFLYVGNRSQAKVMVLDRASLELLSSFGEWGSAPGQFGTLHHMASDSKGNLYVTEVTPLRPENRRVQKFVTVNRRP